MRRPVSQTDGPGVGRLDHGAPAHVHGHVLAAPGAVEEEVTGLEVRDRHRGAVGHLGPRVVGQWHPGLAPGPGGESRAVEPVARRLAAPDVGDADLGLGRGHCGRSGTPRRGGRRVGQPAGPPGPWRRRRSGSRSGRAWAWAWAWAWAAAWAAASLAWAAASAAAAAAFCCWAINVAICPFTWLSACVCWASADWADWTADCADASRLGRLGVLLVEGGLLGREHVLGGVQVVDGGGEVALGHVVVLACVGVDVWLPEKSGSVAADDPVVHVGVDGRLAELRSRSELTFLRVWPILAWVVVICWSSVALLRLGRLELLVEGVDLLAGGGDLLLELGRLGLALVSVVGGAGRARQRNHSATTTL